VVLAFCRWRMGGGFYGRIHYRALTLMKFHHEGTKITKEK
jgi:hypothetical protein